VADLYLADQLKPAAAKADAAPAAQPSFVELPEQELKDKVGAYRNPATGQIWRLHVAEGKLWVNVVGTNPLGFQLSPLSATRFRAVNSPVNAEIEFQRQGSAGPLAMQVTPAGQKPATFTPVELFSPTPAQLAEYAGEYYSEELGVTYRLALEEGRLVFKHKHASKSPLFPTIKDELRVEGLSLNFTRDEQGRPSGFTLNAGRVKNLRFVRAPAK
jgi:hypothetical protein